MRRLAAACTATLAIGVALIPGSASAPAAGHVPAAWMGVVASDPTLLSSASLFDHEANVMGASGVQTLRVPVYWALMQPYANAGAVPDNKRGFINVSGRPTFFADLDTKVAAAARNRIGILPTVLSSPAWDALNPEALASSPPRDPADYAAFMVALVQRYGPNGAFWKANPKLPRTPMHSYQIWNEPNLNSFWADHPYAPGYVKLLKASHAALKKADPKAQVILGGLRDLSSISLEGIYKAGGGTYFDIAAMHPYAHSPADVVHLVAIFRRTMAKNGDANKPLMLTGLGWSTANIGGGIPRGLSWNTSYAVQAQNLTHVYQALARNRTKDHIAAVYWYSWYTPEDVATDHWEDFTGLRYGKANTIKSKPALGAFAKVAKQLEH